MPLSEALLDELARVFMRAALSAKNERDAEQASCTATAPLPRDVPAQTNAPQVVESST